MSKEIIHIPQADMLMGSMRSMGYSFESAVADVIDNSISADAKRIHVLFPTSALGTNAVGILDDGIGMAKEVLLEAMRYGSTASEEIREETDLGRFGLGLKSASLSQCRKLTVISYWNGIVSAYRWDYDLIQERKQWIILDLTQDEITEVCYFDLLKKQVMGTLVVWENFDILKKANDGQEYSALNDQKEIVEKHLSLIFHRFMSRSKKKVNIYINQQKLKPLEPFLESHPKTTLKKEVSIALMDSHGREQQIRVRPFILPYLSDMSEKDKKALGGVEDMRSKQGFYVYRNERLIIWGNWFGMSRRSELTKNVRIRVDIPNALDDIWSIDVKKQVATIPKRIQNQLTKTVNDALGISVSKQTHRGRKQKIDDNIDYIWDRIEGRDKTFYYQVNRDSRFIKFLRDKMTDSDAELLDIILTELEKNIPLQQIYLDKANDCIAPPVVDDQRQDEIYQNAITMIDTYQKLATQPVEQLIDTIMTTEPFNTQKELKDKLLNYFINETH